MKMSQHHRRGRIGIETWYVLMVVLSLATAAAWAAREVRATESPWRGLLWGVCAAAGIVVYYFGLPLAIAWLSGLLRSGDARRDDAARSDQLDRTATVFYYCMIATMIPPPLVLVAWLVWKLAT